VVARRRTVVTQLELKSRIGPDGVLTFSVPVGSEDANREVTVTVKPVDEPGRIALDQVEWRRFIEETAGCWQGEPLVRPEQGEFAKREEWGSINFWTPTPGRPTSTSETRR
jgi:hypothetical protein